MGFSEVPIGELVAKCSTWNPKASDIEEFDYIDLSSVDKDEKAITSVERYRCSDAPSRARQLVKENDVLVATVRPNLNGVSVVGEEHDGMTASTGYCVLRPIIDKLNPRFLFHWVKTGVFVKRMVDVASGANYPAVSDAKVKASSIPLPPLVEQKRIAEILDAVDALRAKRRESLAQLDALLKSTFIDMFGDPVKNPMGWEESALGDICTEKPTYGSGAPACEFNPSLPRYVRITDVDSSGELSNELKSAALNEKEIEKYRLQEGDVLFARSGATVGKSYLHRSRNGFCVYAGYMIRFRPDSEIMLPEILFRYTQTSAYWRWVGT